MVSARRSFSGTLPIEGVSRLRGLLATGEGDARFELDFGRDGFGTDFVDVRAQASLTMTCQRSLEPFVLPVVVHTRLGLIRHERDEAALPPECEALLVAEDGRLNPADLVEDELLLVLPLVPINPDSSFPDEVAGHQPEDVSAGEGRSENPFAVLRELKK